MLQINPVSTEEKPGYNYYYYYYLKAGHWITEIFFKSTEKFSKECLLGIN